MTQDETKAIIKRVRSLYISQARQYKDSDWLAMADAWYDQFQDESYDNVNRALSQYVNKGKQFIPNVADIIGEILDLEEPHFRKLFERLCRECEIINNGLVHVVVDDYGGLVADSTAPHGFRLATAEAHITDRYTQADFANLPMELQIYAEDIEGLRTIGNEINSNKIYAYKRFKDHISHIRKEVADEHSNHTRQTNA